MVITRRNMAILKWICIIFLIGIAIYSILPDLNFIKIPYKIQYSFFWFLICGFTSGFLYIFQKSIKDKQLKTLMLGGALLFVLIFIFEIVFCIWGVINNYIWTLFSSLYIIVTLIYSSYANNR